jgi:hypothetical protein
MAPVVYSLHNRQWRLFPQNTGTFYHLGAERGLIAHALPELFSFTTSLPIRVHISVFSKYAHTRPYPDNAHTLSS